MVQMLIDNKKPRYAGNRTYALRFLERKSPREGEKAIPESYNQQKQISNFRIGDQEITAEDLLDESKRKNLIKKLEVLALTGGGTGRRDFFWL